MLYSVSLTPWRSQPLSRNAPQPTRLRATDIEIDAIAPFCTNI
ncbi:hypothetical protein [Phormidium tenue]|nr:hypothetical protein [Phormidium tenue]